MISTISTPSDRPPGYPAPAGTYLNQLQLPSVRPDPGRPAARASNPFQFVGAVRGANRIERTAIHAAPVLQPFIRLVRQQRPAAIGRGDFNYYRYALNEPVQASDPAGFGLFGLLAPLTKGFKSLIGVASKETGYWGGLIGIEEGYFFETGGNNYVGQSEPAWQAFFNNAIDFPIFPQVGTVVTKLASADNARNIAETINAVGRSHACGTINAYEAAALVETGLASEGCENAQVWRFRRLLPPTPA